VVDCSHTSRRGDSTDSQQASNNSSTVAPNDKKDEKTPDFHVENLDVDKPGEVPPAILDTAIRLEYRRQNWTFAAAVFFGLVGVVLLYLGISGSVNWSFEGYGVKTNLTNAAPGVVALVIAGTIVLVQRPSVHLGSGKK
jgi:hypothetical protein